MPSFLEISQNQGIELIKFVLGKSVMERVTFSISFPDNSENLLSSYCMSGTRQMQYIHKMSGAD